MSMAQRAAVFREKYGPWAVVAGASEGLGAEYATQLAAFGLNVVLIARRRDMLEQLSEQLTSKHQIQTRILPLDLAAEDLATIISEQTGDLDIGLLVYDAARSVIGPFYDQSLADHLNEIQVNCRAPLILTYTLGQRMIARGRGGIILMSSLSSSMGSGMIANYAATKAYNMVLAEGIWEEMHARGLDVMACAAGAISTPNYLASEPKGSTATQTPSAVVAETLAKFGKLPSLVPGRMNRVQAFAMRRLLPRRMAIQVMGSVMHGMYATPPKKALQETTRS